jgi:hypothetical protein
MDSNPSPPTLSTVLYRLIVSSSLTRLNSQELLNLVDMLEHQVASSPDEQDPTFVEQVVLQLPSVKDLFKGDGWYRADVAAAKLFWQGYAPLLEELALTPGLSYIITNGRVSPT